MIKFENTEVTGWEAAIRGMRNPMNSWAKSDSTYVEKQGGPMDDYEMVFSVGENDLKLMRGLAKAGPDHAKFARMINVTVDIIAPLYWWKEFDTYKVGTVANSCSTMHKLAEKEFTIDDFSHEHLIDEQGLFADIITDLNSWREDYLRTKNKLYWWQMIQLLPSSYNQLRTVQMSYQALSNMYFARRNHKLDCWRDFCKWVETLPYFKGIYLDGMD